MSETAFIETREYQRFCEFCDAVRRYRYIGMCYGPPGIGKTLSASHYANWDKVERYNRFSPPSDITLNEVAGSTVVFYTVPVVNSAGQLQNAIGNLRHKLLGLVREDVEREKEVRITEARKKEIVYHQDGLLRGERWAMNYHSEKKLREIIEELHVEYNRKYKDAHDPTTLIIIDEADRLKMAGLEQMRAIFDEGGVGLVLIGMPGLEKRLARYPQLYSRVGFVHEFRPLAQADVRQLLREGWSPSGVALPDEGLIDEEAIATLIRIAEGKFRLLHRLLTQIGRILEINQLDKITRPVIEAARESLVIGTV